MKKHFYLLIIISLTALIVMLSVNNHFQIKLIRTLRFIDFPTIALFIAFSGLLILTHYKLSEVGKAYRTACTMKECSKKEISQATSFFSSLQKFLINSGLLIFMVGLIITLSDLGSKSNIGKGLAIALLSGFYTLFFNLFLVLPFKSSLDKKSTAKN